jgi:hypothetical protein
MVRPYLQHQGSIQHVLQGEIEALVQMLIGELPQKPDVIQAISHRWHLLQTYI